MKKFLLFILFFAVAISQSWAGPLSWSFKIEDRGNGEVELIGSVAIASGWSLYDVSIPAGGPNPTTIEIDKISGAVPVGKFGAINAKAKIKYDEIFEMNLGTFSDKVTFSQRLRITDKSKFAIEGAIRSQACNDEQCTPPNRYEFSFSSNDLPSSVSVATAMPVKEEKTQMVEEPLEEKIKDKTDTLLPA